MIIEYKGKSLNTIHHKPMSIELFEKLKKEYYKKPTRKAVFEEVRKIFLNGY